MKLKKLKSIITYGYVKEEDGVYTAICVNMSIFAQGKTVEEAIENVMQAVGDYIEYVLEKHPEESEKYLNRPAPIEYIREFKKGIQSLQRLIDSEKLTIPRTKSFVPVMNFAEEISFA